MRFFRRTQHDWSWFEKIMLLTCVPTLQFLAWLYVHYVSSQLHLAEATWFELVMGFLCNFSPVVLLPLWGWTLTLLLFNKPVSRNKTDESV
jgi:hypothetical protein